MDLALLALAKGYTDKQIEKVEMSDIQLDHTLTKEGVAADAKAVGQAIENIKLTPGPAGITPHIGANGNWFIGKEDTGVNAGATDEQISSAIEEYIKDNPLGGGGADGLYFDETTWTLYLMQNGQIIGNAVQLPTTGEGPTNNAILTLENTTGWSSKSIPINHASCIISVNWSSVDGGVSTGSGTVTVKVENELQYSANIKQGAFTTNILNYIHLGENRVDVTITDFRGNSKSILFVVSMYDPDALTSTKLVERTMTGEYVNDRVTHVGSFAFTGNGNLNRLSFPNVTSVDLQSFGNMAIHEIEMASLPKIVGWTFRDARIDVVKVPSLVRLEPESVWAVYINRMIINSVSIEPISDVLTHNKNNVVTFDFNRLASLPVMPKGSTRNVIIRTPEVCTLQTAPGTTSVNVYVPALLVDSYKSATNWSEMADQIFAIEDYPEICEVNDND